jgi:uncharacterized protein (DUF169 family)
MKNTYSRREVLELGLGSVALIAGSRIASAADTKPSPVNYGEEKMTEISEFNRYGEDLEKILLLRTSPIAVKMLEKESDIPEGAVRPSKDRGQHWAQCQAFALSRREMTTVAMLKEDHWCPTALIAYGMVPRPESLSQWSHPYESFEEGKYVGIVTAPLKQANFIPDVVIIFSNPAQQRGLLLTMPIKDVPLVNSHFFPPSCAYSVVHPMMDGKYWIVLPDPGDYQRALTGEDEMMLAVPRDRMKTMMANLRKNENGPFAYRHHNMFMQPNFERPDFYKQMFKSWGLNSE